MRVSFPLRPPLPEAVIRFAQQRVLRRWVRELRSGRYQQGKYALRRSVEHGDEYCCLGVLMEMAVREGIIPPPEKFGIGDPYLYTGFNRSCLDDKVMAWSGLDGETGKFRHSVRGWTSLAELNDGGFSFTEIASVIREYFIVPRFYEKLRASGR